MTVSFQIFNSYAAKKAYTNQINSMATQDVKFALNGWKFTQPDYLADGLNPITGGAFGGLLNRNGRYGEDGNPPENIRFYIA